MAKRAGLGRGLSALMAVDELHEDTVEENETVSVSSVSGKDESRSKTKGAAEDLTPENSSYEVDIDKVKPNPEQPRTYFDPDELSELADSIKKNGLLQPVLVRRQGKGYQIIAGERRWQACKKIGLKKIPVRVTDADDAKTIALAMVENVQRSDLNPMEEAYGYRLLLERNHMTQAEIAEAVSKGRSTIANTLRLIELPEDAQQLLFEGKITAGHARAILSIPTEEGRATLTRRLVERPVSVRDAENIARLLSGKERQATAKTPLPPQYKKVAKSLREVLGTNVRIKTVKGKNKIEIDFEDEAELEALFRKIVSE